MITIYLPYKSMPINPLDKNPREGLTVNQATFFKVTRSIIVGGLIFIMTIVLSLNVLTAEAYAQKKKKKGESNGEVDAEMARKKYIFELNKSWSFGYENYKNKQYPSSAKHFWRVVKLDTINRFPKVYRYMGDCYLKMDNPDSAQVVFELGSKKHPDDAHLHRMVGFLKSQRGQVDEAIIEYEKVAELKPESVDDLRQLAALYVKADRIDDAIATYDKILTLNPDDLDAQNNQAALMGMTGDIEGVIANKEKIRAQDPQHSRVRFDLGKLYFDNGDYEKSIELFNEFLTLSPNDAAAMKYIGDSYNNLERYNDAIAQSKKILKNQPNNKEVMVDISRSYKELGRFSSARLYANKARAVDRSYGLGWIALGEAYEASAEHCVGQKDGKVEFNDKLVYKLAAIQYEKARNDLAYRQEAERHLSFVQAVLPTADDYFMHKNQSKPTGECYDWLN